MLYQNKFISFQNPEAHFVNFVNVEEYFANIENFNSFLAPFMEIDKTFLEMSNEQISDELETCKKRLKIYTI